MSKNESTTVYKFDSTTQKIFFTSDTHFGHANIIKYCNRPFANVEEMNETLINNWNSVVGENDVVFHLGDFGFGDPGQISSIIDKLNGDKYLILGNHDMKIMKQGYTNKFKHVTMQMLIQVDTQRIYLNHFPFLCFAGAWRGVDATWQLFGHVHSTTNTEKDLNSAGLDVQRLNKLFPTQYDVGVDNNNYTPVEYNTVKNIIVDQMMSLNMHRGR